jgi:hypothetical protein
MQNRTTNWTFDLHVENQLVCSTLNEKYFQRVEQSPIKIQGKKAMLCPQRCKLSKYVFMILTFSLWPWNSNRVCCYYTEYVYYIWLRLVEKHLLVFYLNFVPLSENIFHWEWNKLVGFLRVGQMSNSSSYFAFL